MVERMARAIYEAAWNSESDQFVSELDDLNGNMHATLDGKFDMRTFARAILQAMREPTDAMVDAGNGVVPDGAAEDCWQRMLNAALKEGQ